jgi:hypothetical protein
MRVKRGLILGLNIGTLIKYLSACQILRKNKNYKKLFFFKRFIVIRGLFSTPKKVACDDSGEITGVRMGHNKPWWNGKEFN